MSIESSRKTILLNHLFRAIPSKIDGLDVSLLKKIFRTAVHADPLPGLDTSYRRMTANEFFEQMYFRTAKTPTDKKKIEKIEALLEALTKRYDSMYAEDNQLFVKIGNSYRWNGNKRNIDEIADIDKSFRICMKDLGIEIETQKLKKSRKDQTKWSRLGYSLPSLFTVSVTKELRQKYLKIEIEGLLTVLSLASVCRDDICFTSAQIEASYGTTLQQLKPVFKALNIKTVVVQSKSSWFEKKGYELPRDVYISRGVAFTSESIATIEALMKELNFRPDWKNVYKLRVWFYQNKQMLASQWFDDLGHNETLKEVDRIFDEDTFKDVCKDQSLHKSVALFKEASLASDVFRSEKCQSFEKNLAVNQIKPKKDSLIIDKDNRNISSKKVRRAESLSVDGELENEKRYPLFDSVKSYADFCIAMRAIYKERAKEAGDVQVWITLKDEVQKALEYHKPYYHEELGKHLKNILDMRGVLMSPVFYEEWHVITDDALLAVHFSLLAIEVGHRSNSVSCSGEVWNGFVAEARKVCKEKGDEFYQNWLNDFIVSNCFTSLEERELRRIKTRDFETRFERELRKTEKNRNAIFDQLTDSTNEEDQNLLNYFKSEKYLKTVEKLRAESEENRKRFESSKNWMRVRTF